jgi:DNA-binding protein YbaB
MGMFDKLQQGKELLKMRSQAKALQKQLADVTETVEMGDVKVKVTADQKVVYIEEAGEGKGEIVNAVNEAFKKVQKKAAQKMLQEGGLSGLLGGKMGA